MSKKLISLLLSLVLIVGTVAVPGRAADEITITFDCNYSNHGGYFQNSSITGLDGTNADKRTRTVPKDENYGTLPVENNFRDIPEGYTLDGWYTAATGGTKLTDNLSLTSSSDHTIYAHWVKKTRTVTLKLNGGKYNNSVADITEKIPHDSLYSTVLSKYRPTLDGSVFKGWTEGSSTDIFDLNQKVTTTDVDKSLILTAKWVEQCTVTFDPNGGSVSPTSKVYSKGDVYGTMPTPTKSMYEFTGWFTATSSGTEVKATDTVNATTTLYAQWKPAERKVIFEPGEGTLADADKEKVLSQKEENGKIIYSYPSPLPTPSLTYHDFKGWFTSATNSTKINGGEVVTSTDLNVRLYAQWTRRRKTFKVFTVPGGTNGEYTSNDKFEELTVDCGTTYADIKEPKRDGYTFGGWCSDIGCADTSIIDNSQIVTLVSPTPDNLYAKWNPSTYIVTLDPNDGELADDKKTVTVTYGVAYPNLKSDNVPTYIGYEFTGWFTEKDGGTEVTNSTKVTETGNHILYAHWKPRTYDVTLNYNVPTLDPEYSPVVKKLFGIDIDAKLQGLPSKSQVPGYEYKDTKFTFYNWYTKDGAMVNSQTPLTPDMLNDKKDGVNLNARWEYGIKFYYNTGTSSSASRPNETVNFITDTPYGNKLPTPTNTGKTLLGWFTDPDNGTPVSASDIADGEITELYAHWTTSEYVVTLDANGGKFRDDQKIRSHPYQYGDTYGDFVTNTDYIPTPPAGHTFIGWYTEKEGGSKVSATEKVTKTCTLYAHWKADQFKVTLDLGYDSKTTVHTVDYDTELSKVLPSPEPDRTGYAFEGWFEDKAFTKPADTKLKIQADITLYAKWKEAKRVSLDVGGGKLPENTPAYINVYEGGTYAKLPTPTWPGSIFKGWWTTPKTGGKQVKPSDTVPAPSSIPETLYARWESKKITVYLDYNGAPGEAGRTITCSVGDTYKSLPTYLSWAGHEFMGWYTKETGGEKVEKTTIVSVPSDDVEELTLFAHWGYTVVFEPGDGSGTMDKVAAEMDQPYTLPECTFTAPDGMRFGGWAIGSPDAPTQPAGSQYTVVRNLALYATWTDKPITITVTCTPGGSLATDDGKTNTVTAERGTDVTFIARPNAGYELKDLQVDGVSYNYTVEYTFRRIEEDHKIHAVFGRIDAPSYSSCDHGTNCPLSGYRDLNSNAWYHDAVHFCMDNVIMGGSNNSFKPNAKASRAEVATSLWSAEGREPVSGNGPLSKTYPDVAVSDWYYQPIEWATRRGILAGYSNGRFGPNDSITREQLVSVLWRHAGNPKPRSTVLRFNDASKVSGFAWDAMLWATEKGIISGRPGGYLAPKGNATRADVAQVLKNYLN